MSPFPSPGVILSEEMLIGHLINSLFSSSSSPRSSRGMRAAVSEEQP